MSRHPIAIVGAGPVGLAAAAHLLARGQAPIIFEAGPAVGHSIRQWGHVRMFTPWRYCIDTQANALLSASGWSHPPHAEVPTGADLVARYLEPLAALPDIASRLHLSSRVVAVSRKGCDKVRTAGREAFPFVLRIADPAGGLRTVEASAVIDTSGTWAMPNPMASDGLPVIGEAAAAGHIATGIPDVLGTARQRYAGKRTTVVGGGHSALNTLIELAELQKDEPATRIVWIMRKPRIEAAFGGEELDGLPARGALGSQARRIVESGAVEVRSPFLISRLGVAPGGGIEIHGDAEGGATSSFVTDEIIVATGFRPDLSMLRELRLSLHPWLECAADIGPLIDPNLHSCGTVRPHGARELAHAEPGFFIAGMKSYGRAPTFLLATGYEQVRSIAAALAGDAEAAARVELVLPETGVCSTSAPAGRQPAATQPCCGAPASAPVAPAPAASACCGARKEVAA